MNITAKWYYYVATIYNGLVLYVMYNLYSLFNYYDTTSGIKMPRDSDNVYSIRWWPYVMFIMSVLGLILCYTAKTEKPRMAHGAFAIVCTSSVLLMYCVYWLIKPLI
jgi:hypothetical protein